MTLFLTHRLGRIEYQEVLQVTQTVWLAFKTFFTVPRCNPLSCIVCHSAYGSYNRLSQWSLIDVFTMGTLRQYSTQPLLEYLRLHFAPTFTVLFRFVSAFFICVGILFCQWRVGWLDMWLAKSAFSRPLLSFDNWQVKVNMFGPWLKKTYCHCHLDKCRSNRDFKTCLRYLSQSVPSVRVMCVHWVMFGLYVDFDQIQLNTIKHLPPFGCLCYYFVS